MSPASDLWHVLGDCHPHKLTRYGNRSLSFSKTDARTSMEKPNFELGDKIKTYEYHTNCKGGSAILDINFLGVFSKVVVGLVVCVLDWLLTAHPEDTEGTAG